MDDPLRLFFVYCLFICLEFVQFSVDADMHLLSYEQLSFLVTAASYVYLKVTKFKQANRLT